MRMSTISERIKIVRQTASGKKMSRDEFAAALGVTNSVVTNWEDSENRLKNGIPEYQLKHICDIFHVKFLWLSTGEGEMMEKLDPDLLVDKYMPNESEFAKTIMRAFAHMPDEEWIKFRDLIDRIKKEGV